MKAWHLIDPCQLYSTVWLIFEHEGVSNQWFAKSIRTKNSWRIDDKKIKRNISFFGIFFSVMSLLVIPPLIYHNILQQLYAKIEPYMFNMEKKLNIKRKRRGRKGTFVCLLCTLSSIPWNVHCGNFGYAYWLFEMMLTSEPPYSCLQLNNY